MDTKVERAPNQNDYSPKIFGAFLKVGLDGLHPITNSNFIQSAITGALIGKRVFNENNNFFKILFKGAFFGALYTTAITTIKNIMVCNIVQSQCSRAFNDTCINAIKDAAMFNLDRTIAAGAFDGVILASISLITRWF